MLMSGSPPQRLCWPELGWVLAFIIPWCFEYASRPCDPLRLRNRGQRGDGLPTVGPSAWALARRGGWGLRPAGRGPGEDGKCPQCRLSLSH